MLFDLSSYTEEWLRYDIYQATLYIALALRRVAKSLDYLTGKCFCDKLGLQRKFMYNFDNII